MRPLNPTRIWLRRGLARAAITYLVYAGRINLTNPSVSDTDACLLVL